MVLAQLAVDESAGYEPFDCHTTGHHDEDSM